MGYRVGVVEDHALYAAGLRQVLAGIEVEVAAVRSVAELPASGLHLVILDLLLGDGSAPADNIARLRGAGVPVLVVTSGERPDLVREALRAGVVGVVRKSERDEIIVDAVRRALRGEPVDTVDAAAAVDGDTGFLPRLSPREREALTLWASGETAPGIADIMDVSVHTVHTFLRRVRQKYEETGEPVRTKAQLRAVAQRDGLVPRPWWRIGKQ